MKFTDKSTLREVLEFGGADEVLARHKVPCLGCPMAQGEMAALTLERICQTYGIDEKALLEDLNGLLQSFLKKSVPKKDVA